MATRLYFHQALSELTNLPTMKKGDAAGTYAKNADDPNINRTMNDVIGSTSTSKALTTLQSTSELEYYFTRFVSEPLAAQTINANTWTYSIITISEHSFANFPCSGSDKTNHACVYVWRPSTESIVGFIIDGLTNAEWDESTDLTGLVQNVTFSGSSVSVQADDVLCMEMLFSNTKASTTTYAIGLRYDGDIVQPQGTTTSNHASFLETPQNLTFVGDIPNEIDAVSDYKDILVSRPVTKV